MISHLKKQLVSVLPPFIADNDRGMRFQTTAKFAGLKERKFLFLTSSGPLEISFKPLQAMMIAGGSVIALALSSWAALMLPTLLNFSMPTLPEFALTPLFKQQAEQVQQIEQVEIIIDIDTADDSMAAQLPQTTARSSMLSAPLDIIQDTQPDGVLSQPAAAQKIIPTDQQIVAQISANTAPENRDESASTVQVEPISPVLETAELDPEFKNFNGLETPPIQTAEIKFHKQYHFMLTEAKVIQDIFAHFNIQLDNPPPVFSGSLTANKEDLTSLYLHRDSWRKLLATAPLKPPLRYYYITSPYGWRTNKNTGKRRFHHGVDLAGTWRSEIQAPSSGIVSFAGTDGGYGKTVRVEHGNGIETVYAHLSSISVRKGDYVTPEVSLGKMGNTGHSDGMHLHYEVRIDGKSIDPARLFNISHQIGVLGNVPSSISY